MYRVSVDRVHHIIIGNAVPNLECEMKLNIRAKHTCLGKGGGQYEQPVDFRRVGWAPKKIKPGAKSPGLIPFL